MNLFFLGTELQNLIYQIELRTRLYLISHSQSSGVGRADTDRPLNKLKTQFYISNTFAVYQEYILNHVISINKKQNCRDVFFHFFVIFFEICKKKLENCLPRLFSMCIPLT